MSLRYRLAFYLFGLMIGIVFVYFFMTKKAEASGVSFCYFPNCRVLKDLRSKPLKIGDEATKKFDEKWVTLDDIKMSLEHGEVDFSESNESFENGKLYIVEGKTIANQNIIIEMISYEDKVILKDIKKE
ncbi:DUF4258 domain-containing protein [uncultured Flavobacterium sp.]|uniref:DUF4258 domain-containing protein n=1 Tax=uncultured Flavobacterium sp. TaxID=165435 RepID=UPI0030EC4BEB